MKKFLKKYWWLFAVVALAAYLVYPEISLMNRGLAHVAYILEGEDSTKQFSIGKENDTFVLDVMYEDLGHFRCDLEKPAVDEAVELLDDLNMWQWGEEYTNRDDGKRCFRISAAKGNKEFNAWFPVSDMPEEVQHAQQRLSDYFENLVAGLPMAQEIQAVKDRQPKSVSFKLKNNEVELTHYRVDQGQGDYTIRCALPYPSSYADVTLEKADYDECMELLAQCTEADPYTEEEVEITASPNDERYLNLYYLTIMLASPQPGLGGRSDAYAELFGNEYLYPKTFLYDADGFGEAVIDMNESQITVGDALHSFPEDSSPFLDLNYPYFSKNGFVSRQHLLYHGLVPEGTLQMDFLRDYIGEDTKWLYCSIPQSGEYIIIYGGSEYPAGWDSVQQRLNTLGTPDSPF